MDNFLLEVCVDSAESAVAAARGGADRLELCANLIIGGTTPGLGLYHMVKELTGLPVRVLIRPRFGDFLYTDFEKRLILEDIHRFASAGADGVVTGALCADGSFDTDFMERCVEAAGTARVTCHRAFDMCKDAESAIELLAGLGVDTILTSGQEESVSKGAECLAKIRKMAGDRIHILAGGGVSAQAIPKLYEKTGICNFHLSAKKELESCMEYRNPNVSMGLKGLSEYTLWRTDEDRVREAKKALICCAGHKTNPVTHPI